MLALTRRVGEEIVIGDPRSPLGVIRIVEIHGDKVRLSFNFPKETPINRKEVAELKAKGLVPPGTPGTPGTPAPGNNPGTPDIQGKKASSQEGKRSDAQTLDIGPGTLDNSPGPAPAPETGPTTNKI